MVHAGTTWTGPFGRPRPRVGMQGSTAAQESQNATTPPSTERGGLPAGSRVAGETSGGGSSRARRREGAATSATQPTSALDQAETATTPGALASGAAHTGAQAGTSSSQPGPSSGASTPQASPPVAAAAADQSASVSSGASADPAPGEPSPPACAPSTPLLTAHAASRTANSSAPANPLASPTEDAHGEGSEAAVSADSAASQTQTTSPGTASAQHPQHAVTVQVPAELRQVPAVTPAESPQSSGPAFDQPGTVLGLFQLLSGDGSPSNTAQSVEVLAGAGLDGGAMLA